MKLRNHTNNSFSPPSVTPVFQESELSLVDAELALQTKIYEAARKLCQEDHTSKAVKKSRLQQCKREERKLKQLQETTFQLRMKHGRSSPLPAFNIAQQGERSSSGPGDNYPLVIVLKTKFHFVTHFCLCLFFQIWAPLMTALCLIL